MTAQSIRTLREHADNLEAKACRLLDCAANLRMAALCLEAVPRPRIDPYRADEYASGLDDVLRDDQPDEAT